MIKFQLKGDCHDYWKMVGIKRLLELNKSLYKNKMKLIMKNACWFYLKTISHWKLSFALKKSIEKLKKIKFSEHNKNNQK